MSDDKNKKPGVILLPYATYCIKHKMGIGSPKKQSFDSQVFTILDHMPLK